MTDTEARLLRDYVGRAVILLQSGYDGSDLGLYAKIRDARNYLSTAMAIVSEPAPS